MSFLDASTGKPVPARVELLDAAGDGHVARDALPIIVAGGKPGAKAEFVETRVFTHPQTGKDQFYSSGRSNLTLPAGKYTLRAWKGLEYRALTTRLKVRAGQIERLELRLKRWIDMPRRGWFGADDHLHIPRPSAEADPQIHQWMAAEDIHVANLLQMGTWRRLDFAAQHAHGEAGQFRAGHHLLISGQENPRTHFLGHMIILGTESPIHYPDDYLNLTRFFEEGRRQGALNGVAHFGRYGGAQFGLGLMLPHGVIDFLEVVQFEEANYDVWYKILNTGFRMTPTAGTDYPWGWSHPGRERFYTRVLGGFSVDKWKAAVRGGHTFVTNGPMLSFRVNGQVMGSTLELPEPGDVEIEARVDFDDTHDRVYELELIENGVVVRTCRANQGSTRIRCPMRHDLRRSGWLAIRSGGWKKGLPKGRRSVAHSAPVYVSIANTPPLSQQEEARRMARSWIAILNDLENALSPKNINRLSNRVGAGRVHDRTIHQGRAGLLEDIREAREYFRRQDR